MRRYTDTIAFKVSVAFTLSVALLLSYLAFSFKANIKDALSASEKEKAIQAVDTLIPIIGLHLYLGQEETAVKTLERFASNGNIEAVKLYSIADNRAIYSFSRQNANTANHEPFIITKTLQDELTKADVWRLEVLYSSVFLQKLSLYANNLLNNIFIIVGIIFFVLLLSLLYLLSPLKQVANAIKNYKPGSKLQLTIRSPSHEVETIANALMEMESKIQEYEKQLEEINDTLELKIAEKTQKLQDANNELERINNGLESRVKEQTKQMLENERLLIQQSKLAAMGEMIGAIAHQWRQPLNALGILVQDIREEQKYSGLTEEYLLNLEHECMKQINFMSDTIDDFRNFFKPNKEKASFSIQNVIKSAMQIISAQLKSSNIEISMEGGDFVCFGYSGEFSQVILNLISNAKDAILDKRAKLQLKEKGLIVIKTSAAGAFGTVTVSDNGCGIQQEIIDKIFDPYFTTKEQGRGTGLGLYMSKLIVEKHIGGNLQAQSSPQGSTFTIRLKTSSGEGG